ncbi:MAG: hypothetical protein N3B21_17885 [Clostridia bacterium]|nr:hypothetical protein [Clostridia bacterium]
MSNTKISYLYRDGDNYKKPNSVIISGEISKNQIEEIIASLDEGLYFIPSQVGLPEVRFDKLTESDHCWFELLEEGIETTNEEPTIPLEADVLHKNFLLKKENWDDTFNVSDADANIIQTDNREGRGADISNLKIFVIIDMFQDIVNDVCLFLKDKEAQAKFKDITGVTWKTYEKNGSDKYEYEDWIGTTIYEIPIFIPGLADLEQFKAMWKELRLNHADLEEHDILKLMDRLEKQFLPAGRRKKKSMKKKDLVFTATFKGSDIDEEVVKAVLKNMGAKDIDLSYSMRIEDYIEELPDKDISGFYNSCYEWITHWGSGGGDYSTESCIKDSSDSDNPRQFAQAAYDSIVDYTKSEMEAVALIATMVNAVLYDMKCKNCDGTGKMTSYGSQEHGIEDTEATCDYCNGLGYIEKVRG